MTFSSNSFLFKNARNLDLQELKERGERERERRKERVGESEREKDERERGRERETEKTLRSFLF